MCSGIPLVLQPHKQTPVGQRGLCRLDGALLVVVDTSWEGDEDEILQKEGLWEGFCA